MRSFAPLHLSKTHRADVPIAPPKSTISRETSLDLLADSVQSSSESENQTSEKAVQVFPRRAFGRKINRLGTRWVVLARGLGRVRNNWADATKQSLNNDVNWNDPVYPRQRFLFTSDEIVNIQPDNPTSPVIDVKTFLTNELADSIVIFTNKKLILWWTILT